MNAAAAIIAALSVQCFGGGIKARDPVALAPRAHGGLQRRVGGDAARKRDGVVCARS